MIPVDHFFNMNNGYKFISGCNMHEGHREGWKDEHPRDNYIDPIPICQYAPIHKYSIVGELEKVLIERLK